jgi:hypothetical protein
MDDPSWRLTVSLGSPADAEALAAQLRRASAVDAETTRRDLFAYATTREAAETLKGAAWEAIRALDLKPTLIRIDEWLPADSCWSNDPPRPAADSAAPGLIGGLLDVPWPW